VEVAAERVESMVGDESRAKAWEAGGQTRDGGRITTVRVFYVAHFFSTSYFFRSREGLVVVTVATNSTHARAPTPRSPDSQLKTETGLWPNQPTDALNNDPDYLELD
jgi:hypothetical protein